MGVRESRRREKQAFVLDKAGELIYNRGYQYTSMKDVAAACGLGMHAIYSLFVSKEQICAELYLRELRAFAARFEAVLAMDKGLPEINRELVEEYILFYTRYNFLYEIVWLVVDGQFNSTVKPETTAEIHGLFVRLLSSYARLLASLCDKGIIRSDLDPRAMAATLWSMVSGMAANYGHKTGEITGVDHRAIRAIELEMVLDYLKYRGADK